MKAAEARTRLIERADRVAPLLLGWILQSQVGDVSTGIRITEVEAYELDDPASHSHRGPTERNASMFSAPGTLYAYRSYGIHWCANVVCGPRGHGAAALIRGGEPVGDRETMVTRRGRSDHLTDGPGKLCQALGITGEHDGLDLFDPASPLRLIPEREDGEVAATPRVGISRATDREWRFVLMRFSAGT